MGNFFTILLSVISTMILFSFLSVFFNGDNGEFAIAILIGVVIALQCIILKKLSGINQTK